MEVLLFLKNVAVGFLSLYLAFTNVLAERIEAFLPRDEAPATAETHAENETGAVVQEEELAELPSRYDGGDVIPRILIENTAYQRASVVEGAAGSRRTAATVEEALVNILCRYQVEDGVRTTAGTGFFIHENGAILTNAHVAQFLLLEAVPDIEDASCTIRTGDPAEATYKAELLYLPPAWVTENAALIREEHPRGTGERDYALLYVSETLDGTPLPATFPALSFDTALLSRETEGTMVTAAGYPAAKLFTEGLEAALSPVQASATLTTLYTFGTNYADLMALSGSAAGEQGSSGGPVVNGDGDAIGLIVTKGNHETDGEQSLRAVTLSYVDRTITEETGFSLAHTLSGDLARRGRIFKEALAPFLSQLLAREMN